jgi:iron complex outermembrane receptor protein
MQIADFTLTENNQRLQEVVVSSGRVNKFKRTTSEDIGKMPLKDLENPQVYTTISKELIQEQMLTNFNDALRNAPGVTKLFTGGGDFQTTFSLRGFPTSPNLRNGVGAANTSDLDPANIEKIEILKGPAGTLFGSTQVSFGGLINRVTKQPYDHFGGEASYTGGSYGLNRFTADINTPLSKDSTVLLRVNAANTHSNSYMDFGFNKTTFLAPTILFKPNDRLSISIEAEFYNREGTSLPAFFVFDQMNAKSPKDLGMDYKRSFTNNEITFRSPTTNAFGQVLYKLSPHWTSQSILSFSRGNNNGYYQWDNFTNAKGDSLLRTITNWEADITTNTDIQQNFISDYKWGKLRNRLVAGLDFYRTTQNGVDYYIPYDTVSTGNPGNAYTNIAPSRIEQIKAAGQSGPYNNINSENIYAAYLSDVFNLSDNLIVNAALRVDHFDNKGSYHPVAATWSGGYQQTAVSPKFGVVYQPVKDQVSLFANYSNGFQNNTGVDFNGKTFKPSQGNQTEGGVKLDAWGHKLSATLSYYYIHATNLLVADPVHNGFSMQNGEQVSQGFEASIIAEPVTGLNLIAGYAHNNKNYNNAGDNSGVPANSLNWYASYHVTEGVLHGLGAGFGGNYAAGYAVNPSAPSFTVPAYTILSASLFYDQPRYRLGIKADNLTNEHYWVGWFDIEPQQLRSISATLAIKF